MYSRIKYSLQLQSPFLNKFSLFKWKYIHYKIYTYYVAFLYKWPSFKIKSKSNYAFGHNCVTDRHTVVLNTGLTSSINSRLQSCITVKAVSLLNLNLFPHCSLLLTIIYYSLTIFDTQSHVLVKVRHYQFDTLYT